MRPTATLVVLTLLAGSALADGRPLPWTQLSRSTCGVDSFQDSHPEADGRGVVVAVLDTGVDMGVLGLTLTPQGEAKVIDVQDFTGQGDVALKDIRHDRATAGFIHYGTDGAPEIYRCTEAGNYPPGTRFWFGVLDEARFKNSDVPDINNNGRTDDTFGMLVALPPDGTADDADTYVDTNLDRDWSDETPLRNYHVRYDTFRFAIVKKEAQFALLTCALNVDLAERKVVIHFDDGGHGTHVAGIAAGYRINGQPDFHGVAPGAKIISLKIGNNTLAGGATTTGSKKKAFAYAADYARTHHVPVVCNLSYGIGSEREGQSDIDRFLDEFCRANPAVIVFSSAGNAGPGLSTIGTPAAGNAVITVAALLAADSGRDVMGVDMTGPQVAVFSSRGGELAKPTLAVPGYATSTVPRWNRRSDFWRGTSMASPYAAGMGAVMISNVHNRRPDVAHRSSWIKTALQKAAAPMYGFTPLDYGAGVPDMGKAAAVYDQMASTLQSDALFDYTVSTLSPSAPDATGTAAFWRSRYLPTDRDQSFDITPRFAPTLDAEATAVFARQYQLRSDADWLISRQQQVVFRSEQSATVRLDYDAAKLTEPGLYVGAVEGVSDGNVGFRLVNTVVVPHTFDAHNGYRLDLTEQEVDGWRPQRQFVAVPPGASAMHLTLRARPDKPAVMAIREIFKPDGSTVGSRGLQLDTRERLTESHWTVSDALGPGVWEICTYASRPDEAAYYDLGIRFSGVQADPAAIGDWEHVEGKQPAGHLSLIQLFEFAVPIKAAGAIEGYQATVTDELTPDEDRVTHKVKFNPNVKAVRIETTFSEPDFARFTDVAVNLYDAGGAAIGKDGMNYRSAEMTVSNPDHTAAQIECELQVQAAFADHDADHHASAEVKITYLYSRPIAITVDDPGTLYPGIARRITFQMAEAVPQPPDQTVTVGHLTISSAGSGDAILTVPIVK